MALHKNSIPILEYDDSPQAVLMPTHEDLSLQLPEKAVFAFLGDTIEQYAAAHSLTPAAHFISATKLYPVFITKEQGESICLCQAPVGAAPATQILDWMIGYGVKKVISAGSCGTLVDLSENRFLIPVKALRDEGTSYHYLPPERFVEIDPSMVNAIETAMKSLVVPFQECITWTTDSFYRETQEKIDWRREEGCTVVEMECSALAACAKFRGIEFGQILYTADTLADPHAYDQRSWGRASSEITLRLCLNILHQI